MAVVGFGELLKRPHLLGYLPRLRSQLSAPRPETIKLATSLNVLCPRSRNLKNADKDISCGGKVRRLGALIKKTYVHTLGNERSGTIEASRALGLRCSESLVQAPQFAAPLRKLLAPSKARIYPLRKARE